ncbi:DNA polymerase III subunit gamma/tau [Candidatus Gottesmanbacteria bacterium]|nr:DNA polymerase III subunit gamma/tau [Candidatus Gottesmanbacteria bacterium]
MSFYRIYRPQVIGDIDNLHVQEQLLSLLTKDKKQLPHAFLFSGPRGGGKTTAARVIAKIFNCTKITKSGPCGTCDQCVSIAEGKNLDVLEIDAASNRGIDEIRQLRDAIHLSPSGADFKVYIIDEVHMLTTEAFNALLKTLEEPPVHAVFVLATTDPQKVPVTITSRCIHIAFSKATTDELIHALRRIVKSEKLSIDDDALLCIAQNVDGSFRDAVKLLEQVSFHKGKISAETVRSFGSMSGEKTRAVFLEHLSTRDVKESLSDIASLIQEGADIRTFLVDCLRHLQVILVASVTGAPTEAWDMEDLKEIIRRLTAAYGEMRSSPIASLPLELTVVEWCGKKEIHEEKKVVHKEEKQPPVSPEVNEASLGRGLLTLEKLTDFWPDFIQSMKPYNHSVAGVLRSARPKAVEGGIVTIEAFYTFHQEKLGENKTREELATVLKKLFGEKVKVEVVLGKK